MSVVSIVKVHRSRVTEAVRHAVGLVDGMSVIRPGDTVLIKPNLVRPSPSGSGIITDARVTEAVAQLVLEHGPKRVIIGEGSSVGYDFPGQVDSLTAMEVSGTAEVARKFGLQMIDLNHDEVVHQNSTAPNAACVRLPQNDRGVRVRQSISRQDSRSAATHSSTAAPHQHA